MQLKNTEDLTDGELLEIVRRNENLEARRRSGELASSDIFVVIDGHPVRAFLPSGSIKNTFMAAVGHSLRMDAAMAKARLSGRQEGAARQKVAAKAPRKPKVSGRSSAKRAPRPTASQAA